MQLTLLVRAYCHLCDEMLAAVQPLAAAHGAAIDVVDVDARSRGARGGVRRPGAGALCRRAGGARRCCATIGSTRGAVEAALGSARQCAIEVAVAAKIR